MAKNFDPRLWLKVESLNKKRLVQPKHYLDHETIKSKTLTT